MVRARQGIRGIALIVILQYQVALAAHHRLDHAPQWLNISGTNARNDARYDRPAQGTL